MTTFAPTNSIDLKLERWARRCLSAPRFDHTQRVVAAAERLADRFAHDRARVRTAALAHDIDRERTPARLIASSVAWGVPIGATELRNPVLLHGPVASARLRRQFGVDDASILAAVRDHTLGGPDLDAIGWMLYVADYCEPGRSGNDSAERECILCAERLEAMVIAVTRATERRFGSLAVATRTMRERLTRGATDGE